ncbi:hypothetical protein SLA2020_488820 [Shorea laevis]
METNRCCILILIFCMAASMFSHCDASKSISLLAKGPKTRSSSSTIKHTKKLELMSKIMSLVIDQATDSSSNTQPYGVGSPFSLPPLDSLAPIPLPENSPPYCVYPPLSPQTPSITIPTPAGITTAPPPPYYYIPPAFPGQSPPSPTGGMVPRPPETVPSPTIYIPSPPSYEPSPPGVIFPSPPSNIPSPSGNIPSPVFLPPIVYPPPTVPPPPLGMGPSTALWCVAKPSVPEPIIQEAMNYACGSGADCDSIQPDGKCFEPDTTVSHASYAFNSYWQKSKVSGGTCGFGGTAILVTVDPSYDGCHFEYY